MPQSLGVGSSVVLVTTLGALVGVARAQRDAVLMAVLNTTPDSFFDGGRYSEEDAARKRIDQLLQEGATIIDVGAESTRPGAKEVGFQEQIDRAAPAISHAVEQGACVSIDTSSPRVAREALRLGAKVINDVSCLADPELARVASKGKVDLIIMHSRGSMSKEGFSNYDATAYGDVIQDLCREWETAKARATACGQAEAQIWFDPGLGFHKNGNHSGEIMRHLSDFRHLGAGMVLGASRKSFIGQLDGSPPEGRIGGSIAACLLAYSAGVDILRVHDVHEVKQALLALQTWTPPNTQRGEFHA